jgi:hypothetical protein
MDVQVANLSIAADATLSSLCQHTKCDNCSSEQPNFGNVQYTLNGPVCVVSAGCETKLFRINGSILDGCISNTYKTGANGCEAPSNNDLGNLCTTSITGCPENSNYTANCSTDAPCFSPENACVPSTSVIGCRPENMDWEWNNLACLDVTPLKSITISPPLVTTTIDNISGKFELDMNNVLLGSTLIWDFTITEKDDPTHTWQDALVVDTDLFTFSANFKNLQIILTKGIYYLDFKVYQSVENSSYFLKYTLVTPYQVELTVPIVPVNPNGPTPIKSLTPVLSRELALGLASDVTGAVNSANSAISNIQAFSVPSTDIWNNSLPNGNSDDYIIVPCTSIYCRDGYSDTTAMFISAWDTTVTATQKQDIESTCSITNPNVSYAVYVQQLTPTPLTKRLMANKNTIGNWLQPLSSDPQYTWLFTIIAYAWSGIDPGVEDSKCVSEALPIQVRVPTTLYSSKICYNINPIKPEGDFKPGNFMIYEAGKNYCSSPINTEDVLSARDFSCLINNTDNTKYDLTQMQIYNCYDIDENNTCQAAGQGCGKMSAVTTVRHPMQSEEETSCIPPSSSTTIPCEGYQYCQSAACNCPDSVDWGLCNAAYAEVTGVKTNVVSENEWTSRVNNLASFIIKYNLNTINPAIMNVTPFLDDTQTNTSIKHKWDTNYGVNNCPLPNYTSPTPTNCDLKNSNSCKQNAVCGSWEKNNLNAYLYQQEIVQYPGLNQQQGCCTTDATLTKYVNGCCCPNDNTINSCSDYNGKCKPVSNELGNTWCS